MDRGVPKNDNCEGWRQVSPLPSLQKGIKYGIDLFSMQIISFNTFGVRISVIA